MTLWCVYERKTGRSNSVCHCHKDRIEAGMERCGGLRKAPLGDELPEFFKVFLPYTSSQKMSIPEAFIKNFNGVIPSKVILFDHSMKPWHVNLEQTDERLFFNNGWQGFAKDHSLEFGDFLTFKYHRNSSFEVKIFGKNGCKKEVVVGKTISTNQDFKVEKTCCRPAQVGKQKHLRIGSKENEVASCSSKVDQCKIQDLEENKMLKDSPFVPPKNPYFVLAISNYSRTFVHLPRMVLRRPINFRMMPNVVIHNQNGNTWPVKMNFPNNGRIYFGRGWHAFIQANNIKVGDQCVFEFILGGENLCNEVHIQILRGNARLKKPSQHRLYPLKANKSSQRCLEHKA